MTLWRYTAALVDGEQPEGERISKAERYTHAVVWRSKRWPNWRLKSVHGSARLATRSMNGSLLRDMVEHRVVELNRSEVLAPVVVSREDAIEVIRELVAWAEVHGELGAPCWAAAARLLEHVGVADA